VASLTRLISLMRPAYIEQAIRAMLSLTMIAGLTSAAGEQNKKDLKDGQNTLLDPPLSTIETLHLINCIYCSIVVNSHVSYNVIYLYIAGVEHLTSCEQPSSLTTTTSWHWEILIYNIYMHWGRALQ
jgi:hypothetical protein